VTKALAGSSATSFATLACSARLYSTTGGQVLGALSEPTLAQAVNKIVAATRAAACRIQHLAVNGMCVLQRVDPLGGTASALSRAAEVKDE
jgi:hypothetical protein